MKTYQTPNIKNVVLLGHSGCGKTTFAECMLFEAGLINRRGTVEDQNTMSDYHEIEKEKGKSIFSTLLYSEWKGNKINIIDTPGYDDFVGEVISSLRAADTGIMILNAQNGVEVGTEIIWEYTENFKTPMVIAVNQVDAEKSDFDKTVEQAKERFGSNVTVVQYPLNQGEGFDTIVDVLKMICYKFPADGGRPQKLEIPDDQKEKANKLHNDLIESIAENDEGLMELYFEKGTLTEEEMVKGLKLSMINHDIFPLFCCSSKQNMGSGRVMGFVHDIAPASCDMPAVSRKSGKTLDCDPDGPTVAFVFKTISEPHLGEMSFFKVYSGKVSVGDELVNNDSENSEKINQLYVMKGKQRESVDTLYAGDIGATVKLKSTKTNSTLYPKGSPFNIDTIKFPEPRIRRAVETDGKGDIEKVAQGLHHIQDEDPTVTVEQSRELKQTILYGQGELHLDVVKWKLENQYKAKMSFSDPKIPYRETIQTSATTHYRHKKQSGGSGQFGEVHMTIEPYVENMAPPSGLTVRKTEEIELDWGGKLVFNWCIVGGSIDAKYQNAIIKGIMEKMEDGPLTGSYVRDIRVSVFDGKMHAVDSNDMAFKIAAMMAFKDAFAQAKPKLMEPIHRLEILVDSNAMGDVMSDLQTRRGVIEGMDAEGHYQKIVAKVPLAELNNYSSTLRSLTQGKAKYTTRFHSYDAVPYDIQAKLVKQEAGDLQEA